MLRKTFADSLVSGYRLQGSETMDEVIAGFMIGHPLRDEWHDNQTVKVGNIACWNGHEFEVLEKYVYPHHGEVRLQYARGEQMERVMYMYHPVDRRIIADDVAGATLAYPNDDNTAWLFRHADEGTHHDYELNLLAALDGVMQPLFRQYQVDIISATSDSAKTRAEGLFTLMSIFYGECITAARNMARDVWLGFRQQNPHPQKGYLDTDITNAILVVETAWKDDRPDDLIKLNTALTYLRRSLNMPSVETRWDKIARLAAEAKAMQDAEGEEN